MAGTSHDQVNPPPAENDASGSSPAPLTTVQAKARLLAAAAACDPGPFIQKHPFGSVIGAAALGMLSAQAPGAQRMISMVIEAILKYSAREPAEKAGPPGSPTTPP